MKRSDKYRKNYFEDDSSEEQLNEQKSYPLLKSKNLNKKFKNKGNFFEKKKNRIDNNYHKLKKIFGNIFQNLADAMLSKKRYRNHSSNGYTSDSDNNIGSDSHESDKDNKFLFKKKKYLN